MQMSRRSLLMLGVSGLAGIALGGALVARQGAAQVTHYEYSPDVLSHFEQSGQPYILNFWASWCTTCAAQQRVIGQLQAENPDYLGVPIIRVNWDEESRGPLVARLAIPRRSTMVLMRGTDELLRLVADTRRAEIEAMLAAAL